MSLVGSATSFGNRKLYALQNGRGKSGLSTSIFNSDNRGIVYTTESCSSDSYDPKYFLDSPTEVLLHTPTSGVSGDSFHSEGHSYQLAMGQDLFSSSFVSKRHSDAYCPDFELEYLESQIPEAIDYDDDKMRLKLQELERVLLTDDDNNDNDMFHSDQSMDIDVEWADPIDNVLHDGSSMESSSLDSNNSRISSNKDMQVTGPHSPRQLLLDCAVAISDGQIEEASTMINDLRQSVSIQGGPRQRIAAYMVEALAARMATSGKGLYKALKCKEPPSLDRLSAMQVLFEVCPCFRFGFMAANGAILEACKDEKRVHIIDFDINQGSQYYTLLQTLTSQPGERPHLRLTGVDDPESVQRAIGGLKLIGQRLEKLAEALELPFEFQAVAAKTAEVTPAMLDCHPKEALIVNFAFQLHHMPDESVSTVNQRDQLLRMVKSMNPKLVTVVEQDMNTNTAPFLPRFVEAYNYYSAVFDSLDATVPRESQERMNVERQCLARDIINIVACEGEERIERCEVAGKWRARMMMAGFASCPVSPNVKDLIQKLIKQYSDRFKVISENGSLHFGWEEKILVFASAWR